MSPRAGFGPLIVAMAPVWSVKAQMLDRDDCWTLVDVPGDDSGTEPDRMAQALNLAAVAHVLAEIDGHGDPMTAALDVLTGSAVLEDDVLRWALGAKIAALLDAVAETHS